MQLWRERLGKCLGFDASAPAPTAPPRILLMNRRYHEARHLENGVQLSGALQDAYGGFANVTFAYAEVRMRGDERKGEEEEMGGEGRRGEEGGCGTVPAVAG